MRLLGQVLHAMLQELEFAELRDKHQSQGRPLYCQGLFDAITSGEIPIQVLPSSSLTGFGSCSASLGVGNVRKPSTRVARF